MLGEVEAASELDGVDTGPIVESNGTLGVDELGVNGAASKIGDPVGDEFDGIESSGFDEGGVVGAEVDVVSNAEGGAGAEFDGEESNCAGDIGTVPVPLSPGALDDGA